jgi:dTDP-4-dehydrorhamnose reductase
MIAETTALAVQRTLQDPDPARFKGTYHLCASGATSWHGFAEAIVARMRPEDKKCREIQPISSAEWPTPTKRPAYSVLSNDKLRRTFGLELPAWDFSLDQVMES